MRNLPRIQSALQQMDSSQFEKLVANVWSEMGWSTQLSQPGKDQGVDVVATKSNLVDEKALIQVKRYRESNKVGRPEIQQYSSLENQFPDADSVIVVTSSEFTQEATQLARQLGVKTVNGMELAEACETNLLDDRLSEITDQSRLTDDTGTSSDQQEFKRIQTDRLTASEQDLANFYSGHLRRLSEAAQDTSYERSLFVKVDRESSESSEYVVRGVTHQIQFPAESPKLLAQLRKTAEQYGWKVLHAETYGPGAGGVEMIVPPEDAEMFYIALDTEMPKSPDPERQARILNLVLERVYNQNLSGTEIVDLPHGRHSDGSADSIQRVIK